MLVKRNSKIVKELEKLAIGTVEYNKEIKTFSIRSPVGITQTQHKKIEKLGLKIVAVSGNCINILTISLKHRSSLPGIIIGLLSLQVILFGFQMLWLATQTKIP